MTPTAPMNPELNGVDEMTDLDRPGLSDAGGPSHLALPHLKLPAGLEEVLADELMEQLVAEINSHVRRCVSTAVSRILVANFGYALGSAVYADLADSAEVPNSTLVGGAVTRAAVSKAICRIRRGLGLGVRAPSYARPKRKVQAWCQAPATDHAQPARAS